MKCVAPNWRAAASFAGFVSTAMIGSASERREALDDVEADAADADHHGRLAVGRLRPVEHRADAGEHAAADEAGRRERHVGIDHDRLGLGDDGVLGEHPGVGELERLVAADRERRPHLAERLAAVGRLAAVARGALAAVAERGEHDVVAHLHLGDGVAHLLDHPGALVAEHDRRGERDGAVDHAHVAVAQAGRVDAHLHLVRARRAHLHVVANLERAGPDDRLHRGLPRPVRSVPSVEPVIRARRSTASRCRRAGPTTRRRARRR